MSVQLSEFCNGGVSEDPKPIFRYVRHSQIGSGTDCRALLTLTDDNQTRCFVGGKELTEKILTGEMNLISNETILRLLKISFKQNQFLILRLEEVTPMVLTSPQQDTLPNATF